LTENALSTLVTKPSSNFISRRLGAAAYEDQRWREGERVSDTRFVDLDAARSAVLASLRSTGSRHCYDHAIAEFIDWYCSEPRLGFNKIVVTRYRMQPTNCGLGIWKELRNFPFQSGHYTLAEMPH